MASLFPEEKPRYKMTFDIQMQVTGWTFSGEDATKAVARMALEAEQLINARGDLRAHITLIDGEEV